MSVDVPFPSKDTVNPGDIYLIRYPNISPSRVLETTNSGFYYSIPKTRTDKRGKAFETYENSKGLFFRENDLGKMELSAVAGYELSRDFKGLTKKPKQVRINSQKHPK